MKYRSGICRVPTFCTLSCCVLIVIPTDKLINVWQGLIPCHRCLVRVSASSSFCSSSWHRQSVSLSIDTVNQLASSTSCNSSNKIDDVNALQVSQLLTNATQELVESSWQGHLYFFINLKPRSFPREIPALCSRILRALFAESLIPRGFRGESACYAPATI